MKLECKNIHNKHVELDIPSVVTISDLTGYSALTDLVIDTDYENTNIYSPIICRNATATVLTDDIGWYSLLIDNTYSCYIKETREVNGVDVEYTIWSGCLSSISESNAFANGKEPITLYMIDELSKLKNIIIRKDSDGVIRRSDTVTGFPNEFTIIEFKNMFMNNLPLVSEISDTNFYDIKFPISAYINAIGDKVNAFDILKQMAIFLSIQVSIGQNNILYFKKNILIQSETDTKDINFSGNNKNIINTDNLAVGLNSAINKVSVTSSIQEKRADNEEEKNVEGKTEVPYRVIDIYKAEENDPKNLDDIVVNNDTAHKYRYRVYEIHKSDSFRWTDTWWSRPCSMYQHYGQYNQSEVSEMKYIHPIVLGTNRFYFKPHTTYYGFDCTNDTQSNFNNWLAGSYDLDGTITPTLNDKGTSVGTQYSGTSVYYNSSDDDIDMSTYITPLVSNQMADNYNVDTQRYKSRAIEVETKLNNGDTKHSTMIINAGDRFYFSKSNYPVLTESTIIQNEGKISSHFEPVIRTHQEVNNIATYDNGNSKLLSIRCKPSVIFKERFGDIYPDKDAYEDIDEAHSMDTEVIEMKYEDYLKTGKRNYKERFVRGGVDGIIQYGTGPLSTSGNLWPAIGIRQEFNFSISPLSFLDSYHNEHKIEILDCKLEIRNAFVCDCPKEGTWQDFFNVEYKPDIVHYCRFPNGSRSKYGSVVEYWKAPHPENDADKEVSYYLPIVIPSLTYRLDNYDPVTETNVVYSYNGKTGRIMIALYDTELGTIYFSTNFLYSNIPVTITPKIPSNTKKPADGEFVTTFGTGFIEVITDTGTVANNKYNINIKGVYTTYYLRNEMWLADDNLSTEKIKIPNIVFNHEEEYEMYDYINGVIVDNDNNNAEVEYTWLNDNALTTNEVTQDMKFSSLTGNIINGANTPSINGTPVTTLTYGWNKNYTPEQNYFGLLYSQYHNNPFTVNLDVKGYFEPHTVFNINSTTINQIKANSTKYKPLQMSYNVIDSVTSVNMESIEPIDESLDINIIDQ